MGCAQHGASRPAVSGSIPEKSPDVEGQQKTPDYAFHVGQSLNFYVEAKKCAVDIGTDPAPAFQLRRYGWNARLSVSILTNFEQFAVYDCTQRPRPSRQGQPRTSPLPGLQGISRPLAGAVGRVLTGSGLVRGFRPVRGVEAGQAGDLGSRRRVPEGNRGLARDLARNIALRNPRLSNDDLNAAVQAHDRPRGIPSHGGRPGA